MKKLTKLLALVLALVMVLSLFAGCSKPAQEETPAPSENTPAEDNKTDNTETPADETPEEPVEYVDPTADMDYDEASAYLYEENLGEFYEYLTEGKEAENVSEGYALMALAEAKLLESGLLLPQSSKGGNYAISRLVRRSASTVLWGNDAYRFHNVLVATEPIAAADQAEIVALWNELRGTGTFTEKVKELVTSKGYTLKDTYSIGYASDPKTWDVQATSRAADSEAIVNTYDGLMEYDNENELKPALAESYESKLNDDGTETYTFHLRQGAKWTDSQGRELGEVTADDFVAGMQHVMDAMGGLEYLLGTEGANIVNADAYVAGEVTDFTQVGVKAVDDYTLEYTCAAPCSYFITMVGYGVFAPLNRAYFLSKGGAFGLDEYAAAVEAGTCTYGQTPNDIAYCGPYLVTSATAENSIVFQANPSYWNADNITIKTLTWMFNDGKDATKAYNDMKSGVIDGCALNSAAVEAAKADNSFDTYAYTSDTDATSFCAFTNLNRFAFANFNDTTTVVSSQTEEQAAATKHAMRNVHFRRALLMAWDVPSYNAQVVGEELKYAALRNSYTPGNFVSLLEDVTVSINGTEKTYPAGTYYGQIVQDQIDADGVKITVWDAANQTSDGFAGWYNVDNAVEELNIAIEELAAEGLEVSAENPIYIDIPCWTTNETYANRGNVTKQSIENALGGAVVVNLVECVDAQQWYYAGYYADTGADGNYDIYDVSGWGPDYGDPSTYLNTMLPDYAGYMTKCTGMF